MLMSMSGNGSLSDMTCETWPASGSDFRPGTAVFEFLEPIPAGLKRGQFMAEMQEKIEAASAELLAE